MPPKQLPASLTSSARNRCAARIGRHIGYAPDTPNIYGIVTVVVFEGELSIPVESTLVT